MGTWWQHCGDKGGEERNWPSYLTCQWLSISVLSNWHSPTYASIRDDLYLLWLGKKLGILKKKCVVDPPQLLLSIFSKISRLNISTSNLLIAIDICQCNQVNAIHLHNEYNIRGSFCLETLANELHFRIFQNFL